jgi:CBS domain-containing protein
VDGKADWMAYGLPVEGTEGPFLGARVSEVVTCDVGLTAGDARRLLTETGTGSVVVGACGGLVVGEVDAGTLEGHADADRLVDVMGPVPTTVRPSVTVASLAEAGGGRRLVTTSDGRLLGQAVVEGHDHDHDDHEGHDHGGDEPDMEAFEQELTQVMAAVEERFGDREPTEAELRSFLRDRLVTEGRTPEDADRFLDQLAAGEDD